MKHDPQRQLCARLGIRHPLIQAPMAGAMDSALVIAVARAGGLGSLPCAMLSAEQIRAEVATIRANGVAAFNLNFFCHTPPSADPARENAWRTRLLPYYQGLGLDPATVAPAASRAPFDESLGTLVEELRPPVVSFHFGLPAAALLARVKAGGATVLASATTVDEARWLEARGCDAIIAQGIEAGGHRGHFLQPGVDTQPGLFALLPQVVDAVRVPVVAAGGIGDARGIRAALALGATAVQLGSAYLLCPEARISALHRAALQSAGAEHTALTNLFSGRPARGIVNRLMAEIGPLSGDAPAFPLAGGALAPLRAAAEARGSTDFSPLWAGQAARLAQAMPAEALTRALIEAALGEV